jgi:hypothetical protein
LRQQKPMQYIMQSVFEMFQQVKTKIGPIVSILIFQCLVSDSKMLILD